MCGDCIDRSDFNDVCIIHMVVNENRCLLHLLPKDAHNEGQLTTQLDTPRREKLCNGFLGRITVKLLLVITSKSSAPPPYYEIIYNVLLYYCRPVSGWDLFLFVRNYLGD